MKFIDTSVVDVITYFVKMGDYVLKIALDLGRLLTFVGFLWTCLQVVMGQKKMADMLVGTAMKWLMFFFVFSMYPGFCTGLRKLSTNIGNQASGTSISFINKEITDFFTEMEKLIAAKDVDEAMKKAQLDVEEEFRKRREEVEEVYRKYDTGVRVKDDELLALAQAEEKALANATKKAQKKTGKAAEKAKKKFEEKLAAFKEVIIIDEKDQISKYKMDLSLKSGNTDIGLISPASVLKVVMLISEIMAEAEVTQIGENGIKENIATFFLPNLTLKRMQNIILSGVCSIGMILTCAFVLIQYVMAIIEYAIIASFSVILVPCMLFDGLKDLSNKILPSLMAQAIKLIMIIICLYWSILSFAQMGKNIILNDAGFDLKLFGFVVFNLILILAICTNAPKLACTLLTGQPQMSMGEFMGAVGGLFTGAKIVGGASMAAGKVAKGAVDAGLAAVGKGSNAVGNIAQSGGAAKQAFQNSKSSGNGTLKSSFSGAGAFVKDGAKQTGTKISEGVRNIASGRKGEPSSLSFKGARNEAQKKGGDLHFTDYVKGRAAAGAAGVGGAAGKK